MFPSKASCSHPGLVACGKRSTDLELGCHPAWWPFRQCLPGCGCDFRWEPSQSPNYRKSKTTRSLQCRAKNSLENNSKAFSNFQEIDECFGDSAFRHGLGWALPSISSTPTKPESSTLHAEPASPRLFATPAHLFRCFGAAPWLSAPADGGRGRSGCG